jgi:CRISPR system Cascade subunit CasE
MFLSKLALNPRERDVQRDLRDAYQMHRTLSRGWGQGTEYQEARVLFRVEEGSGACPVVLVQSKVAPDWSLLPSKYFGAAPQQKEWQAQLAAGRVLSFRLRANPTRKREGKRRGLYLESERLAWLERKALENGFSLGSVVVRDEGRTGVKESAQGESARLRQVSARIDNHRADFSGATFDGILQVVDATTMQGALENGIGSGKGLGFGLLSLTRS